MEIASEHKGPVVSVCVQTYQQKDYIRECLDSILSQQTSFPFEVILGEDESTDGTREICLEYANRFPDKIRLFLRSRKDVIKISGKPTGRFNFMENLKACHGKYIALCEGDDHWLDVHKLQRQVDFLQSNPEFVLSTENSVVINTFNGTTYPFSPLKSDAEVTVESMLWERQFHTASVLFRRESMDLPGNFAEFPFGDTILFVALATKGKVKFTNISSSAYRRHIGGVAAGKVDAQGRFTFATSVERFNMMLDDYTSSRYRKMLRSKIAIQYYSAFKAALKERRLSLALASMRKVVEHDFSVFLKKLKRDLS